MKEKEDECWSRCKCKRRMKIRTRSGTIVIPHLTLMGICLLFLGVIIVAKLRLQLSTGLSGLDRVFRGLMPGDNIVWQLDSIADYGQFVEPYYRFAKEQRQKLIYFRFADHPELITSNEGVEICRFDTTKGFEPFIAEIHKVISANGRGTLYLFDCLSELAPDWRSDRMLGNFFMLTCPYLYDRAAIAYFALLRNRHSFHALNPIVYTTQILVNVYKHKEKTYIHPIKVLHRHSSTMYMLHVREDDDFKPVTQSGVITEVLAGVPWYRPDSSNYQLGYWSKTFAEAEAVQLSLEKGEKVEEIANEYFLKLLRMLISQQEPVLRLAEKYFTLKDLLNIRHRMIGTGLIGGKAVGMLLARAILNKTSNHWQDILEHHDSFYVGSDVFYTYLVQSGFWWMVQRLKTHRPIDEATETTRRRLLTGEFPDYILQQFSDMLDYFGQSPIIVRSSSIMEDNFGTAFAGKYESVFCANQGGPHKRLEDFLSAVRLVYASTMNEEALAYRSKRSLLDRDEQMSLLIQRVSGSRSSHYFFPQAAGVGFSFNPYVWHKDIAPEAGMIRLVFGMGTRAVDRSDDDYTRIVALNIPTRRPESTFDQVREYAQHRVDVLDLEANHLCSTTFDEICVRCGNDLPIEMFASKDRQLERALEARKLHPYSSWVLTFDKLLSETNFVQDLKEMLKTLQDAYQYPVDIEFTLNFIQKDQYQINLVQCRPLQVQDGGIVIEPPADISESDLLLRSKGPIIGKSALVDIEWLVYVVPSVYGKLPVNMRYHAARVIGDIVNHAEISQGSIALFGPGRWGTSSPELGIPVSTTDIQNANIVCELVEMHETLIPDVSLGTHFFNEIVENDMLYLALFVNKENNYIDRTFLKTADNHLLKYFPKEKEWEHLVRLIKVDEAVPGKHIKLHADCIKQQAVCYISPQ